MARTSFQLHWKTSYSIFCISLFIGLIILSVIILLTVQQGSFEKSQLLNIYLLPFLLIILFSSGLSWWVLHRLSRPLNQIEQISLALPLVSAKKYQQARQL